MESGYEKDPQDLVDSLEALHEPEPPAPLDLKETQERGVILGLRRTQEAQDLRDRVETQGQKARRDRLDHVETPETRGLQDPKGQEEMALLVILVQREM